MNDSEGAALLAAINENPADLAPRLIYSDWLEENGRLNEALAWRGHVLKSQSVFEDFESGAGDWHGSGDGYWSGHGYGLGYKYGLGDGGGYLLRDGNWDVEKKQNAWLKSHEELITGKPVIGKQMLIWCGRGFAWIGHVDEMYAPGCYKLSNAGMLCSTGSDTWMAVASGEARDNYVYRHAPDGIVYTGPELHGAVEWKGELPGRDMR